MKRTLVLLSIVGLILVLAATPPALAAKSYFAERYDTTVMVHPDGALNVTETVVFRFEGGPFTYVFRDLRYADLDEIDRLQASLDGQVLPQGTQAGQVEITAGHPLKVTWHFPATSDSTHEFTLVYRVQGAIRQDSTTDTLIWRTIPEEHDYKIRGSTIRIEYPPGVNPTGSPALTGVPAAFEAAEQGAVFTTQEIGKNTPVDVSIYFPSGSLISQPPAWQAAQEQKDRQIRAVTPYGLGAAVLTGVIGLASVLFYRQSFRREAGFVPHSDSPFITPPRPIPPALAARLVGSNTAFLATFFDLAQRGLLQVEEGPKKWGGRAFEVIYLSSTGRLSSHEQVFVDTLFHQAKHKRVELTEVASLASSSQFNGALDQELVASGWLDAPRSARRSRFMVMSLFLLLLGIAIFIAGFLLAGASLVASPRGAILGAVIMGLGVGSGGIGLVGVLTAVNISILSLEGDRQAADWTNFMRYLRGITRGREMGVSTELLGRYLPYAAGFGFATEWAKYFQKLADIPVPNWFRGLPSSLGDGTEAVIAAIVAADSSATAASIGAAGASGGGASGAG